MSAPKCETLGIFQVPSPAEGRAVWRHAIKLAGLEDYPVRMRRCFIPPDDDAVALCIEDEGVTVLMFDVRLTRIAFVDAVLHELTHLHLLEQGCDEWDQHGDVFWCRMGEFYRAWHRET